MNVHMFEIHNADGFSDYIEVKAQDRDHAEVLLLRNGFWLESETLKYLGVK